MIYDGRDSMTVLHVAQNMPLHIYSIIAQHYMQILSPRLTEMGWMGALQGHNNSKLVTIRYHVYYIYNETQNS